MVLAPCAAVVVGSLVILFRLMLIHEAELADVVRVAWKSRQKFLAVWLVDAWSDLLH